MKFPRTRIPPRRARGEEQIIDGIAVKVTLAVIFAVGVGFRDVAFDVNVLVRVKQDGFVDERIKYRRPPPAAIRRSIMRKHVLSKPRTCPRSTPNVNCLVVVVLERIPVVVIFLTSIAA